MADKDVSKAAEPPKPVHIGGESFIDRVLPHIKKIMVVLIVAVVIAATVQGVRWFGERKQITATEKLDQVLEANLAPLRDKDTKPDPSVTSYTSAKERALAVLDAMAKQGSDRGGSFRAGLLLDGGKVDEAITEYRKCSADKTIEGVLCREGLGIALETKASDDKDPAARQKGLEDALAAFVSEQPDEAGPRRAYALYHQARIQLLLTKRAEAKALLDKAKLANKDADREITELIDKRLAALGAT